jgi:hypothetical protein
MTPSSTASCTQGRAAPGRCRRGMMGCCSGPGAPALRDTAGHNRRQYLAGSMHARSAHLFLHTACYHPAGRHARAPAPHLALQQGGGKELAEPLTVLRHHGGPHDGGEGRRALALVAAVSPAAACERMQTRLALVLIESSVPVHGSAASTSSMRCRVNR